MTTDIEKTVSSVSKLLRSVGMPRVKVAALMDDLRADLDAAEAEGVAPERIVGNDPQRFARQLAVAHGYEPVPQRMIGLSLAAFLPMTAIAFIVYVVIAGGGENLGLPTVRVAIQTTGDKPVLQGVNEGWFILATYASAGLLGIGLTLGGAAAYLRLQNDTCIGRTVRNMVIALPLGGALGIGGAMLYAASRNYPIDGPHIVFECSIVATGLLSALWVARRLARGIPRGPASPVVALDL